VRYFRFRKKRKTYRTTFSSWAKNGAVEQHRQKTRRDFLLCRFWHWRYWTEAVEANIARFASSEFKPNLRASAVRIRADEDAHNTRQKAVQKYPEERPAPTAGVIILSSISCKAYIYPSLESPGACSYRFTASSLFQLFPQVYPLHHIEKWKRSHSSPPQSNEYIWSTSGVFLPEKKVLSPRHLDSRLQPLAKTHRGLDRWLIVEMWP
jgi:hypothetical protein